MRYRVRIYDKAQLADGQEIDVAEGPGEDTAAVTARLNQGVIYTLGGGSHYLHFFPAPPTVAATAPANGETDG